jgi:site-specific DNA-methyltransferase (adenine-specific)
MQDRLQELFPVHYRNGNILMINADCMEVMKHIKDGEAELSCVDPPYGIGVDGQKESICKNPKHNRKEHTNKGWDTEIPSEQYFRELERVSVNQIIWGGNYFVPHLTHGTKGWVVWDKGQRGLTMSDCELAYSSFDVPTRIFTKNRVVLLQEGTVHPTQKPVALYKWLLSRYAKPGDRILDTHGGSGSICIACHDLGYDLTWMELDADYYKAACKRYQNHAAQATLFEPAELTKETQGDLF